MDKFFFRLYLALPSNCFILFLDQYSKDEALLPTVGAPGLMFVKKSSNEQYVPGKQRKNKNCLEKYQLSIHVNICFFFLGNPPDVFYKAPDKYKNEITMDAHPSFPVEYLMVYFPCGSQVGVHSIIVLCYFPLFSSFLFGSQNAHSPVSFPFFFLLIFVCCGKRNNKATRQARHSPLKIASSLLKSRTQLR